MKELVLSIENARCFWDKGKRLNKNLHVLELINLGAYVTLQPRLESLILTGKIGP